MPTPARTVEAGVYLTDNAGNPLSGKTVYVKYREHGASQWADFGSCTTNTEGRCTVSKVLSAPKTYEFYAEFPGDSDYEPAQSDVRTIKVKACTSLQLYINVTTCEVITQQQ